MERVKAAIRRNSDRAYWCASMNRNMKLKNLQNTHVTTLCMHVLPMVLGFLIAYLQTNKCTTHCAYLHQLWCVDIH